MYYPKQPNMKTQVYTEILIYVERCVQYKQTVANR